MSLSKQCTWSIIRRYRTQINARPVLAQVLHYPVSPNSFLKAKEKRLVLIFCDSNAVVTDLLCFAASHVLQDLSIFQKSSVQGAMNVI